jgi:hypothetical protein
MRLEKVYVAVVVIIRGGYRAGRVRFGFGRIGSGNFDQKNLSGDGLGSGRFGLGRVGFQVKHYWVLSGLGLGFGFL